MFDSNITILIVDDMKTMRLLVQKSCTELGFKNFIQAEDGAKGWEAMQAAGGAVGLVISDWNMPNSTGLDLLKRVRADSRFSKTPFMLLTAESESSQVASAVQAGVDTYMIKPFTTQVLQEKMEQVHKKRAA
jgi:two-component system chemotaxis response regulator CheY